VEDDLDWLYRRGRYGEAASGAPADQGAQTSRTPVVVGVPVPANPAASRPAAPGPLPPRVAAPRAQIVKRRRHPVRNTFRVLGLLLLAAVVYLAAVPIVAWGSLAHVAYAPDGSRPADQPGTLLLLSGSDSRDGLTLEQTQELGTGTEGGNVADTIMLLYLPPTGRPALVSLPRDSYVAIPGHGKNKINASFAFGGPKLLTQTVEQATGLRVDGYLGIGFGGFVGIIDALGGIQQCPEKAIKDEDSHLDIPAGCQQMDGITALKYVRMRHADPLGDLGRVQRQRGMVAAVAKKAMSPTVFLNPFAYYALNKSGAAALKAGNDTGLPQIAPAALAFLAISRGDGLTLTVPISNPNLDTPAGSSVEWDKVKAAEMFGLIARGDTAGLDKFVK